jgi:hypothetical protein
MSAPRAISGLDFGSAPNHPAELWWPNAKGVCMARKQIKRTARRGPTKGEEKVGSDARAARKIGGKGDFGVSPRDVPGEVIEGAEQAPGIRGGTRVTRGGATGTRTTGVGARSGRPGSGSGGDLDTDIIGVGTDGSGIAARPPRGVTAGPSSTTGSSDEFASGPPARGSQPTRGRKPKGGDFVSRDTSAEIHESDEDANRMTSRGPSAQGRRR